ncbi:response regulator transcription factor [Curtanaerobium respiraculi]|uniref:response regulator transcription factor n=1 Tax=Curtanaerobium respiraculi TaxID=2949669 RepID=UPI0024B37FD0|nr:LuxR C-terminal-related transcriptional regulator [Curtanaerobium respiraculi]
MTGNRIGCHVGSRTSDLPQAETPSSPDAQPSQEELIHAFAAEHAVSKREQEVFVLLLDGCTRGQIERLLGGSEGTVRTHVNAVYRKLDVHSETEMQQKFIDWYQQKT